MTVKISLVKDNKIEKEEEIQVGTYTLGREGDLDIIKNESGISRDFRLDYQHYTIVNLLSFLTDDKHIACHQFLTL